MTRVPAGITTSVDRCAAGPGSPLAPFVDYRVVE